MAVLSKAAIFEATPATVDVNVPEWGGSVRVKGYSLADRVALLDAATDNEHALTLWRRDQELPEDERTGVPEVVPFDAIILEIIFSCIDEKGDRLFDLADHDRLKALSYSSLTAIVMAIRQINEVPSQTALKKSSD